MSYTARPHVGAENVVSYGFYTGNTPPLLFKKLHSVKDIRIVLPSKTRKELPDGFNSSAYTAPGKSVIGELELQSLFFPTIGIVPDVENQRLDVMVRTYDGDPADGAPLIATTHISDWQPAVDASHPEGDGDSTVSAKGQYLTYSITDEPVAGAAAVPVITPGDEEANTGATPNLIELIVLVTWAGGVNAGTGTLQLEAQSLTATGPGDNVYAVVETVAAVPTYGMGASVYITTGVIALRVRVRWVSPDGLTCSAYTAPVDITIV
jgi:hypothetical protein